VTRFAQAHEILERIRATIAFRFNVMHFSRGHDATILDALFT